MLPIIWMSPWNSYFKDKEVAYLLKETILRYNKAVVLVADIPAISTYLAMWYNDKKAKEKAILKWNNLKNRTRKVINELWIDENKVIIVDWYKEIINNINYLKSYEKVEKIYKSNELFHLKVNETSEEVLKNSWKTYTKENIEIATHYLLSEIAFLEYAPEFFKVEKISYVYHKNWYIFEDYISWIFDWKFREYLDFILLENPYETFLSLWEQNKTREELVKTRWVIKCMFVQYYEYFGENKWEYSGLFYDILKKVSQKHWLKIEFVEQTGYWVIVERLNSWFADIFCSPVWPTNKRKQELFFSKSVFESKIFMYFNKDSIYNNYDLKDLFQVKELRIAIKENDIHHDLALKYFPNARFVRVPQLSDISEIIKFVIENKADMTFWEDKLVYKYLQSNNLPKNILIQKSFESNKPVIIYDNCFALPWWEFELKWLLDEDIKTSLEI